MLVGDVVESFVADHDFGELEIEFFDLCSKVLEEGVAGPSAEEHDDVGRDPI